MKEIILPQFLLAEDPKGTADKTTFIYSPHYLSLVLIIPEDEKTFIPNEENRSRKRKTFFYNDESFELIILQNNVAYAGGTLSPEISEDEFLDLAWKFWEDYLIWEDRNIDKSKSSKLN